MMTLLKKPELGALKLQNFNKTSQYPTTCSFGGDLTPASGPPTVDTHLLNSDVVNIATHLYNNAIIAGSFFEPVQGTENSDNEDGEPISAEFFGNIDDPRSLFIGHN